MDPSREYIASYNIHIKENNRLLKPSQVRYMYVFFLEKYWKFLQIRVKLVLEAKERVSDQFK